MVQNKKFPLILALILIIALPLFLVVIKQRQNTQSTAASPDKLEAEGGALGGNAIIKQDSLASGGQYIAFTNQTPTSTPSPSSPTPTLPAGTTYTVPSTIDGTGATDVTAALNNWLVTVPNGTSSNPSVAVFPAGKTYLVSQGIQFKDRSSLILSGYGNKIKLSTSAGFGDLQSLIILGHGFASYWGGTNSNIKVRGFELIASNPTPGVYSGSREHQHGVTVENSNNVEVSDISVRGIGGDGVKIGHSTNINIHNINVVDTGRMGVAVISGSQIIIENNSFGDMGYYVFDIEPNLDSESATDITIKNNTAVSFGPDVGYGEGFIAVGSGTAYLQIGNVTVTGNKMTGPSHASLRSYYNQNQHRRLYNIVFTNNSAVEKVAGPVIEFKSTDGLTVTGNNQPLGSGTLLRIIDSTNVISSPNP